MPQSSVDLFPRLAPLESADTSTSADAPPAAANLPPAAPGDEPAEPAEIEQEKPQPMPPGSVDDDEPEAIPSLLSDVPLSSVSLDITPPAGDFPDPPSSEYFGALPEVSMTSNPAPAQFQHAYYWPASSMCHRPLYFQEYHLERYGESLGILQPGVSAVRFFGTVPALPYLMAQRPPMRTICPSTDDPWLGPPTRWSLLDPWDLPSTMVEASVITGLVFLIP
jgi:hypothetical protein